MLRQIKMSVQDDMAGKGGTMVVSLGPSNIKIHVLFILPRCISVAVPF